MSLSILFTNVVFAIVVESAPSPAGPWTHLIKSENPCPSVHGISVNKTQPMEFFRMSALDNGLAPTPKAPEGYRYGADVRLVCPPIYLCPGSTISFRWYRNGVPLFTTTDGVASVHSPGPALYQLQVITAAGASWLSPYTML